MGTDRTTMVVAFSFLIISERYARTSFIVIVSVVKIFETSQIFVIAKPTVNTVILKDYLFLLLFVLYELFRVIWAQLGKVDVLLSVVKWSDVPLLILVVVCALLDDQLYLVTR